MDKNDHSTLQLFGKGSVHSQRGILPPCITLLVPNRNVVMAIPCNLRLLFIFGGEVGEHTYLVCFLSKRVNNWEVYAGQP
jgi:hypothetical protein